MICRARPCSSYSSWYLSWPSWRMVLELKALGILTQAFNACSVTYWRTFTWSHEFDTSLPLVWNFRPKTKGSDDDLFSSPKWYKSLYSDCKRKSWNFIGVLKFLKFSRWWFQMFFIFNPTWGNDPIWLIFFKWVETTNQFLFLAFE